MSMTDHLWGDVTRDVEQERDERLLTQARVASASTWAFLAEASTPQEFDDRLSLADERLHKAVTAVVGNDTAALVEVMPRLVESFQRDFDLLIESRRKEALAQSRRGRLRRTKDPVTRSRRAAGQRREAAPEGYERVPAYTLKPGDVVRMPGPRDVEVLEVRQIGRDTHIKFDSKNSQGKFFAPTVSGEATYNRKVAGRRTASYDWTPESAWAEVGNQSLHSLKQMVKALGLFSHMNSAADKRRKSAAEYILKNKVKNPRYSSQRQAEIDYHPERYEDQSIGDVPMAHCDYCGSPAVGADGQCIACGEIMPWETLPGEQPATSLYPDEDYSDAELDAYLSSRSKKTAYTKQAWTELLWTYHALTGEHLSSNTLAENEARRVLDRSGGSVPRAAMAGAAAAGKSVSQMDALMAHDEALQRMGSKQAAFADQWESSGYGSYALRHGPLIAEVDSNTGVTSIYEADGNAFMAQPVEEYWHDGIEDGQRWAEQKMVELTGEEGHQTSLMGRRKQASTDPIPQKDVKALQRHLEGIGYNVPDDEAYDILLIRGGLKAAVGDAALQQERSDDVRGAGGVGSLDGWGLSALVETTSADDVLEYGWPNLTLWGYPQQSVELAEFLLQHLKGDYQRSVTQRFIDSKRTASRKQAAKPSRPAILLPADENHGPVVITGRPTYVSLPEGDTLGFLQEHVGGYIEFIASTPSGIDVWGNEEARLVNNPATNMWATQLVGFDIVGPVVLTSSDAEGNTTPLSDEQIKSLPYSLQPMAKQASWEDKPWAWPEVYPGVKAAMDALSSDATAQQAAQAVVDGLNASGGYRDSFDRELAMTWASEKTGVPYNDIYDAWDALYRQGLVASRKQASSEPEFIQMCRRIVQNKQHETWGEDEAVVDMQTANVVTQVYDALSRDDKAELFEQVGPFRFIDFAWGQVS